MKPRKPQPPIKVTITTKPATPERRKRIVRLLALLIDKPDEPKTK